MKAYAKAVVGGAVAGLTSVQASFDGGLSAREVVTAVLAALVAFSAVWAVPNKPSV